MTQQEDFEKKLEEAKRQRELIRKQLDDADQAFERIHDKLAMVKELSQHQKKLRRDED